MRGRSGKSSKQGAGHRRPGRSATRPPIPKPSPLTAAARAEQFARRLRKTVMAIRAQGISTLVGIADELNRRGVKTALAGKWHPTTVRRLLDRIDAGD
jgi:hypothetical protein